MQTKASAHVGGTVLTENVIHLMHKSLLIHR